MEETIYQNTIEWKMKRIGKVTASRVKDIMPNDKGKYSTKRATYLDQCLIGRFGVMPDDIFVSKAMQHGTDTEPLARAIYEQIKGLSFGELTETDMIEHPFISNFSASPDGLVGNDGMLEIKCPTSGTHLQYIIDEVIPEDYIIQMASQLSCSGRKWNDFFSFDNRLPEGLQKFLVRYERDETLIKQIENEVIKFNSEVDAKFELLKSKMKI
jgi:putative phage-type endonuclease